MNSQKPSGEESNTSAIDTAICVVIPTFNRIEALLLCLGHLEKQSWRDFEVIVVDDGSTDSTPQQMQKYIASTPLRLRYLRQQNSGPARARNLAISLTQSPLCLIIGDDIFASADFVETHLRFHRDNTDTCFAALGMTQWSETGQIITPFMRWLGESGVQFAYRDLLRGAVPNWRHFYTSNISLKTGLLRANPFNEVFPTAAVEDVELGYRLETQHGLRLVFLPQALADHLHPTTFRQACKRMYGVGRSMQLFHQLWPEQLPDTHRSFRRTIRDLLCGNLWLLPPLTWLGNVLTRIWCPNPVMRHILTYHFAVGYRSDSPAVKHDGMRYTADGKKTR